MKMQTGGGICYSAIICRKTKVFYHWKMHDKSFWIRSLTK